VLEQTGRAGNREQSAFLVQVEHRPREHKAACELAHPVLSTQKTQDPFEHVDRSGNKLQSVLLLQGTQLPAAEQTGVAGFVHSVLFLQEMQISLTQRGLPAI
jgi:hypothetical protein